MEFRQYKGSWEMRIRYGISMPFIFGMLVPLIFLDLCLELYHRVSFWCYKIPYIERAQYVRIDRHKLSYLRWFEKVFCLYCGYANGLLPYAAAIAARTETYWCPIRHKEGAPFVPPAHHAEFVPYGDEQALRSRYPKPY